MKVQISLDDELMRRVDEYADKNYMSRSGLLSFAVTKFLNEADMIRSIGEMALCMRKIADKGTVDHETMEQLEDFYRLSELLVKQ